MNRVFNKNNYCSSCIASLRGKLFDDKASLAVRYKFWTKINRTTILKIGELLS